MRGDLVGAVLDRLELGRPTTDLAGLRSVYAAWCGGVSFDNVLKMVHVAEARPGSLPGSTADDFFATWLEQGTGGTCWSGNGALHDLLDSLGFVVARGIATMLPAPGITRPNHGTVIVTVENERWIVDASILAGAPIRIPAPGEPVGDDPLPRFEWVDGKPAVTWRILSVPEGFPCRVDRVGAEASEWNDRHQRTSTWSPFNYQLNVRALRGSTSLGISLGQQFAFRADGSMSASPLDREGRIRFLVDELGISEETAVRVPDDRPVPPRPEGF